MVIIHIISSLDEKLDIDDPQKIKCVRIVGGGVMSNELIVKLLNKKIKKKNLILIYHVIYYLFDVNMQMELVWEELVLNLMKIMDIKYM